MYVNYHHLRTLYLSNEVNSMWGSDSDRGLGVGARGGARIKGLGRAGAGMSELSPGVIYSLYPEFSSFSPLPL